MKKSFAVLVLSCDKFADVWPAFFKCFRENFPVGDWPVYLGSNTKECNEQGVTSLLSGSDPDWSTSYKRILEQIPEKKIFVILEDRFVTSKIDVKELSELVNFMFEKNANHIRYWATPLPDLPTNTPLIGECAKGAPYRSTVCGLWDREYLTKLLLEGENPWNFEILGSYRTSYSDGFYATTLPLCENMHMIEKGGWIPASVDWATRNGVTLNLKARPLLKGGSQFKSLLQMQIFNLILLIPWRRRVNLMNHIRRLLISY